MWREKGTGRGRWWGVVMTVILQCNKGDRDVDDDERRGRNWGWDSEDERNIDGVRMLGWGWGVRVRVRCQGEGEVSGWGWGVRVRVRCQGEGEGVSSVKKKSGKVKKTAFSERKSTKNQYFLTFCWLFLTQSHFFWLYLTFFFTECHGSLWGPMWS